MKNNLELAREYLDALHDADIDDYMASEKKILDMASRLDEAEANLEQGKYVHVVQYEEGGIPLEPQLFFNIEDAGKCFEEMVVECQNFRKKKEDESWDDYKDKYIEIQYGPRGLNNEEGLWSKEDYATWKGMRNIDDCVRWWKREIK